MEFFRCHPITKAVAGGNLIFYVAEWMKKLGKKVLGVHSLIVSTVKGQFHAIQLKSF